MMTKTRKALTKGETIKCPEAKCVNGKQTQGDMRLTCPTCKGTGRVKRKVPKYAPVLKPSVLETYRQFIIRADDLVADAGTFRDEVAPWGDWTDDLTEVEVASLTDAQADVFAARDTARDKVADAFQNIEDLLDGQGDDSLYSLTGNLADAMAALARAEAALKKALTPAKGRRARK
jgi:hypothetical protein